MNIKINFSLKVDGAGDLRHLILRYHNNYFSQKIAPATIFTIPPNGTLSSIKSSVASLLSCRISYHRTTN